MNSPKVKTQKNLSAIIALALAVITLFQAGVARSNEVNDKLMSKEEAALIAEIEEMLSEDENLDVIEEVYEDVEAESTVLVKVFDANDKLIGEGNPSEDESLRTLVNRADYLVQTSSKKYFRVTE